MYQATAFSPAGISSFFEIHDRRPDGRPFDDSIYAGARGGGLVICRGVQTHVHLSRAKRPGIHVRINGRVASEAKTTTSAISKLLEISRESHTVIVDHRADVPIGAGYGASAAGTLSAALAFSEAAGLGMSVNELGAIVHAAEIANGTGLGTVGPLLTGGFVITKKSGGPGVAIVDRLPVSPRLKVVSACIGPISTKAVLRSGALRKRVNQLGRVAFQAITGDLRPRNFMQASRTFAYGLGLMSPRTAKLIELMENAGAIGATQNMLGQAVHAVAEEDMVAHILRRVKKDFPKVHAFSCDLDFTGARIL